MLASERVRREQKLVRAVLAGYESAWHALYDGAYAELWNYVVWRSAGLADVADEITQETWLVAVRRIRDFNPVQASFVSWLRGIAANMLLNYFRAKRRHDPQSLSGNETAPDHEALREQAEIIARALAEVPERHESALRAKYL